MNDETKKISHPDDALIITPTEFKDLDTKETTWGYRVCGPEDVFIYCNLFEELPPRDSLAFLALVVDNSTEALDSLFDGCVKRKEGLFIGQTWYDFIDIADVISV